MDRIRKEMERGAGYEHTAYKSDLDNWNEYRNRRTGGDRWRSEMEGGRPQRERRRYDNDRNYRERYDRLRHDPHYRQSGYRFDQRDFEPSYLSTIKNYHPPGGRRIERSQMEEEEMRANPVRPFNRKYNYHDEARNYNREDDYRWTERRRPAEDDHFRERRRYARGDFDAYY